MLIIILFLLVFLCNTEVYVFFHGVLFLDFVKYGNSFGVFNRINMFFIDYIVYFYIKTT